MIPGFFKTAQNMIIHAASNCACYRGMKLNTSYVDSFANTGNISAIVICKPCGKLLMGSCCLCPSFSNVWGMQKSPRAGQLPHKFQLGLLHLEAVCNNSSKHNFRMQKFVFGMKPCRMCSFHTFETVVGFQAALHIFQDFLN